jgi:hypothetical protein
MTGSESAAQEWDPRQPFRLRAVSIVRISTKSQRLRSPTFKTQIVSRKQENLELLRIPIQQRQVCQRRNGLAIAHIQVAQKPSSLHLRGKDMREMYIGRKASSCACFVGCLKPTVRNSFRAHPVRRHSQHWDLA